MSQVGSGRVRGFQVLTDRVGSTRPDPCKALEKSSNSICGNPRLDALNSCICGIYAVLITSCLRQARCAFEGFLAGDVRRDFLYLRKMVGVGVVDSGVDESYGTVEQPHPGLVCAIFSSVPRFLREMHRGGIICCAMTA